MTSFLHLSKVKHCIVGFLAKNCTVSLCLKSLTHLLFTTHYTGNSTVCGELYSVSEEKSKYNFRYYLGHSVNTALLFFIIDYF